MRLAALALVACSTKPDELDDYNARMKRAIEEAAPTYKLLDTMRARLDTATPACTTAPPNGLLKTSSNRLKVFAGELSQDGWLVASSDPAPKLWDDINVPPINLVPTAIIVNDGPQRLAEQRAKIDAAPGFLVSAVDDYHEGAVIDGRFWPSRIRGRVVVFDKAGTPTCHYDYAAETVLKAFRTSRDPHEDLLADLEGEMTVAIEAAMRR